MKSGANALSRMSSGASRIFNEPTRRLRGWVLVLFFGWFAACGGANKGSSATTAPTPTPTQIAISGPDAVLVGLSGSYIASVTLSDGTTQRVTATWSVDDSAVATMNTAGQLSAIQNGTVTISASYQGVTGRVRVGVIANFSGVWRGNTNIQLACDQSGVFIGWCDGELGTSKQQMDLRVTQNRDQVTATLTLGSATGSLSGVVTPDGRLNLGGSFSVAFRQCEGSCITFIDREVTWTISGWDTQLTSTGEMGGRWVQNITETGKLGNAYMEWEMRPMLRIAQ